MQVDGGALRGASTRPRRRRLNVLVAIVVIAAMVALPVCASPLATSGVGTEDANAGAGSAVIHDDPWNLPSNDGSAPIHDDPWNLHHE